MKSTLLTLAFAVSLSASLHAEENQCIILTPPNRGVRPPTQNVPDAGSAMGLMGLSSLGLAWMVRRVRRN